METSKETFHEKLAYGEEGEKQVVEYLLNQGRMCLPMYQFNPKQAPVWNTQIGDVISPDIISIKGLNEMIFVECKRKKQWVPQKYNPNTFRETGIDMRHWTKYSYLVRNTDITMELYFLQEGDESGLYRIDITPEFLREIKTNPSMYRIDTMSGVRMIFFPYELLTKLY